MPEIPNTYTFVCGDDDYLVESRAREVYKRLSHGLEDGFSTEIIDGAALNADEVENAVGRFISAAQTVSLFGERKAVWFKGISFLGNSRTGESKAAKVQVERLADILSSIDYANVGVVLSACPVDQRRAEFKALKSGGDFIYIGAEAATPDALLGEQARECGVSFATGVAEYLFEKLQGNVRLCIAETRKLAVYLAGAPKTVITEKLVDELVPGFGESEFFEPVSRFFEGNLPATLDALKRYFFTRKDARGLISSLQGRNRLLIQMRSLLDSGRLRLSGHWIDKNTFESARNDFAGLFAEGDRASLFSQRPGSLGFLAKDAARFRLRRLIDFHFEFLKAFQGILERPNEQEAVLRETVIRCLGSEAA